MTATRTLGRLILCVIVLTAIGASGDKEKARALRGRDIEAIVQAIEDEIYDNRYETAFADMGYPAGYGRHRLTVYIEPTLRDETGSVIYKLMPKGEVYRMYYIRNDGLAVLHGDPEMGFPPTQPDYLTVYMDDERLCWFKRNWRRHSFFVEIQPSHERISQAVERQKKRIGRSFRAEGREKFN